MSEDILVCLKKVGGCIYRKPTSVSIPNGKAPRHKLFPFHLSDKALAVGQPNPNQTQNRVQAASALPLIQHPPAASALPLIQHPPAASALPLSL
jgi:hypothetical protein